MKELTRIKRKLKYDLSILISSPYITLTSDWLYKIVLSDKGFLSISRHFL